MHARQQQSGTNVQAEAIRRKHNGAQYKCHPWTEERAELTRQGSWIAGITSPLARPPWQSPVNTRWNISGPHSITNQRTHRLPSPIKRREVPDLEANEPNHGRRPGGKQLQWLANAQQLLLQGLAWLLQWRHFNRCWMAKNENKKKTKKKQHWRFFSQCTTLAFFPRLLIDFGRSSVEHCGAWRLANKSDWSVFMCK